MSKVNIWDFHKLLCTSDLQKWLNNKIIIFQSWGDAVQYRYLQPEDDPESTVRKQEAEHKPRLREHARLVYTIQYTYGEIDRKIPRYIMFADNLINNLA